jgi:hypothetical protein
MDQQTQKMNDDMARTTGVMPAKTGMSGLTSRLSIIGSLFAFMTEGSRKFWLLPLVIAMMFVIIILVLGVATPLAPIIYTMF